MKFGTISGFLAISALAISGCSATSGLHPYQKTNHFGQKTTPFINHKMAGPYQIGAHKIKKRNRFFNRLRGNSPKIDRYGRPIYAQNVTYAPAPGPHDMFQRWVDYEPHYTLYPGDQIDVVVPSAPELSRTLTVAPDGRVTMPMITPIMAAGRPLSYVEQAIERDLAKQLRDPNVTVTHRAFAPQNIYVGGQVGQQGTYAISGPIGTLEAIIMAGGFLPSAKTKQVAVLRRHPNGGLMMRVVDHKMGLKNPRGSLDNMQLRRGDIIFVPRNSLSEIGVFVQQLRNAIPVDFGVSYNLGNGFSGN